MRSESLHVGLRVSREVTGEMGMEETQYLELDDVVLHALEQSGGKAFQNPVLLLGFLMDHMDSDSPELRVLGRNLDNGLLAPFRDEMARPEPDLRVAASRARAYLTDVCMVGEEAAHSVAEGIAKGVARWRGLDYVCIDWEKDEPKDVVPDGQVEQPPHGKARVAKPVLWRKEPLDHLSAIYAVAVVIVAVAVASIAFAVFAVTPRAQRSIVSGFDSSQATEEETDWDIEGPRSKPDPSMTSGQIVTWDCVWFGSYPQREITPNFAVFTELEVADWDKHGDAKVNCVRYHRISREDTTNDWYWLDDAPDYRYFLWEPIKWRVLKANDSHALLVADMALDAQQYNAKNTNVTWETSSVRSWLNGYGADSNQPKVDYSHKGFCDMAFTESQREAILSTDVKNGDNAKFGTSGGKDTDDKVFLLAESEVYGSGGEKNGFSDESLVFDEARRCKASDYASAMGAWRSSDGGLENNCWWWLRSPGEKSEKAADVYDDGHVYRLGIDVDNNDGAIRPALTIDLESSEISYADILSSNETVS